MSARPSAYRRLLVCIATVVGLVAACGVVWAIAAPQFVLVCPAGTPQSANQAESTNQGHSVSQARALAPVALRVGCTEIPPAPPGAADTTRRIATIDLRGVDSNRVDSNGADVGIIGGGAGGIEVSNSNTTGQFEIIVVGYLSTHPESTVVSAFEPAQIDGVASSAMLPKGSSTFMALPAVPVGAALVVVAVRAVPAFERGVSDVPGSAVPGSDLPGSDLPGSDTGCGPGGGDGACSGATVVVAPGSADGAGVPDATLRSLGLAEPRVPDAILREIGEAPVAPKPGAPEFDQQPQPAAPSPTVSPSPSVVPTPSPTLRPSPSPPGDAIASGCTTEAPAGVVYGDLHLTTPGEVISGIDLHGRIYVEAENVTVCHSIIRGEDDGWTGAAGLVNNTSGAANLTVFDTELSPTVRNGWVNGIVGSNFRAIAVDINHVIDSIHILGDNVLVDSSVLRDNLHFDHDPNQDGTPSHDDSIQIQAGRNIRITNNTISGAFNSGVQITQGQGRVADVTFSGNHADGGGCTFNLSERGGGHISGVTVADNTFGRDTKVDDCAVIAPDSSKPVMWDNFYTDGTPVTLTRGR
ncbi:MAG: right-handed parallel beta-helix repeat-containing protein [Burkholderiaceae bacterium]|nr:right-handed parallel beta-helix repeat-containing protein [Microbacteriaceae bacterium]